MFTFKHEHSIVIENGRKTIIDTYYHYTDNVLTWIDVYFLVL